MVRVQKCMMLNLVRGQGAWRNISPRPQQKSNGEPEMESRISVDSESDDNAGASSTTHTEHRSARPRSGLRNRKFLLERFLKQPVDNVQVLS